jgi:hypothetical protein
MNGRETNRDMPKNCPQCGTVLPVSALDDLCPLHGSRAGGWMKSCCWHWRKNRNTVINRPAR